MLRAGQRPAATADTALTRGNLAYSLSRLLLPDAGLPISVGDGVRRIVRVARRLLCGLGDAAVGLPLARVVIKAGGDLLARHDRDEIRRAGPFVVIPGFDALEIGDVLLGQN